ncbi:MAG: hypothetical protein A2496_12080 [Burkholderiales bacterium RIFOXYC12_FULL_60_6]|nr:MAG: hypothetical protein A2503_19300 [Burkholderiales bacterium RIFOXYD12_FULL_59_19]OGB75902.1 MAG: hypothetical protein A2496_12080 [Burkholderiales bacterium RIFOXYC12_FULL_60_6]
MNQQPTCTIEPNVGIVEVSDAQLAAEKKTKTKSVKNIAFLQSFVLLLSWRSYVNCNDQRILAG